MNMRKIMTLDDDRAHCYDSEEWLQLAFLESVLLLLWICLCICGYIRVKSIGVSIGSIYGVVNQSSALCVGDHIRKLRFVRSDLVRATYQLLHHSLYISVSSCLFVLQHLFVDQNLTLFLYTKPYSLFYDAGNRGDWRRKYFLHFWMD